MQFSFEKIGIEVGARKALLWGHHLDPRAPENFREKIRSYLTNERVFDCFRMSDETMMSYHRQFQAFRPDCIVAYASALGHFAEFLMDRKLTPVDYPNTCFVTGAEKLYPRFRTLIEDAFGTSRPVHERYGGRDFGLVAIQTDPFSSLSFEVDWPWALLEPETDSEKSSLLVTKLHADAMPLIRYKVGDVCRFPAGSRRGHPVFTLEEVSGRELDRIWCKDGSWIAGEQFPHLLKSFPVREFMLVQDESYAVELQLVTKEGFDQEVEKEISEIVEANLSGLPFRIRTVQTVERTMSNKWRPVISKVRPTA
jgi:phenylacetate-CoA ligase